MKKKVSPQLPKGFTAISSMGSSWRPEKPGDQIEGELVKVHTYHQPKKGKMAARDVSIYTIKTKDGEKDVWESAGLKALADVKKGKTVCVIYVGKKLIKKGQNPMREFIVGVK